MSITRILYYKYQLIYDSYTYICNIPVSSSLKEFNIFQQSYLNITEPLDVAFGFVLELPMEKKNRFTSSILFAVQSIS